MYHHLTLEEREKVFAYQSAGKSLRWIAKRLERSHATLSRELKRNRKYENSQMGIYIPCRAHSTADKRAKKQRYKAPLKSPEIFVYVREHLRLGWSPELIAGRLNIDHPGLSICPETIYQYIYAKRSKTRGMHLEQYLTLKRKKRMKKLGRTVHRLGRIPEAVSIDQRPKSVLLRHHVGHWETDNVVGRQKDTSVLSVTVERKTRYTILSKLKNKTAHQKAEILIGRLLQFPPRVRRSLTADNGLENTNHHDITIHTGMSVYYCHAYHSWEKGTVENTNGRIRRYIPKGVSMDIVSDTTVAEVERILNTTPKKCLNFLTPCEMMAKLRIVTP